MCVSESMRKIGLFMGTLWLLVLARASVHADKIMLDSELGERLNRSASLIARVDVHNKVQEVALRYITNFAHHKHMVILTNSGTKTVPQTPAIKKAMKISAHYTLDLEHLRVACRFSTYDLNNAIQAFSFIYNNTVRLNRIVKHVNDSFVSFKDIEHPRMLDFYNELKKDEDFVKEKDLDTVARVLADAVDKLGLTSEDIADGQFRNPAFNELSTIDLLELAARVVDNNISHSALFYEAARNKAAHEDKKTNLKVYRGLAEFYREYGCGCKMPYLEVKAKLVDLMKPTETPIKAKDTDDDDDDDVDEIDEDIMEDEIKVVNKILNEDDTVLDKCHRDFDTNFCILFLVVKSEVPSREVHKSFSRSKIDHEEL